MKNNMTNNNRFINDKTSIKQIIDMIQILENSKISLEVASKKLNTFSLFVLMLRLQKHLKQYCKENKLNYNDIIIRTQIEIDEHDKIF